MEILRAARPGVSERETFAGVPWGGEPLSYHPVLSSGADVAVGLRSPTDRAVRARRRRDRGGRSLGRELRARRPRRRVGRRPSSARRATATSTGSPIPYWRAMATWYERLELGVAGGDVFREITGAARGRGVRVLAQPGSPHPLRGVARLADPRRLDRSDRERHGDPERHHPDRDPPRLDRELRGHRRRSATRRCGPRSSRGIPSYGRASPHVARFVRDRLGIYVRDEVLPLSPTRAYFPPFWLDLDLALDLRVSRLAGKSVLVTGAARGIGAADRRGGGRGGRGRRAGRRRSVGAETAAGLAERGAAHFFRCDVRSLAEVERAVRAAPARHSAVSTDSSTTPGSTPTSTRWRWTEEEWDPSSPST